MSKKRSMSDAVDDIGADRYVPVEGNALVPVTGRPGRLVPSVGQALQSCPTNIDRQSREGRAMMFAAMSPGDIAFGPAGVATILATHWIVYPDEGTDPETGEVSQFARTVLFDAAGRSYRTSSENVPHRLAAACDMFSADEWAVGIPFVIRERKSKSGRTYHDMRIVWPQEEEGTNDAADEA